MNYKQYNQLEKIYNISNYNFFVGIILNSCNSNQTKLEKEEKPKTEPLKSYPLQ